MITSIARRDARPASHHHGSSRARSPRRGLPPRGEPVLGKPPPEGEGYAPGGALPLVELHLAPPLEVVAVREELVDVAGDHREESRLLLRGDGTHIDMDHQPRHHDPDGGEVQHHRPADDRGREELEGHHETGQHHHRDHRVDHEGEELLPRVVDPLRRQRFLRTAQDAQGAHDEPAEVVAIERDLPLQDLLREVGADPEDAVDEEDEDPGDAIEMYHSGTTRKRGDEMRARPVISSKSQTDAFHQCSSMIATWCPLTCRWSMASASSRRGALGAGRGAYPLR
jgi:hypothetical protein